MQILPYVPTLFFLASETIFPYMFSPYRSRETSTSNLAQKILSKNLPNETVDLIELNVNQENPLGMCAETHIFGHSKLIYDPTLEKIDPEAFSFVMKHEIGHIKHARGLAYLIANCSTNCLFAYAFNYFLGPTASFAASTISCTASILKRRYKGECNADEYAMNKSSVQEIKGGVRMLQTMQCINKALLSTLPNQYKGTYDEDGNNLLDREHPPLTQRIKTLKNRIIQRQGFFYLSDGDHALIKKIIEYAMRMDKKEI